MIQAILRARCVITVAALVAVLGCQSFRSPHSSVSDARNNLTGDSTRAYLDIVETEVDREGNYFAFMARTAAPLPAAQAMDGGKRIDFIWFVDADKNRTTGQNESGNDIHLVLSLDSDGWHTGVFAVSDVAIGRVAPDPARSPKYRVSDDTVVLLVPVSVFPEAVFEWWAKSTTIGAPDWQPVTENPPTRRASTESLRAGSINPTF